MVAALAAYEYATLVGYNDGLGSMICIRRLFYSFKLIELVPELVSRELAFLDASKCASNPTLVLSK